MNDQYLHFSEQVNRKLELYTVGKGLLSIVLKLAVYSYILIAFLKHEVQIGEVAASVAYIVLCVRDVMEIVGSWQQLKNNNAYLERYFPIWSWMRKLRIVPKKKFSRHRAK